jgi:hypothetical protein
MALKKATKTQARLRMAIAGVSGSGKTMTAIKVALGLTGAGKRVAVIDTERGSASKYADLDFDVDDEFQDFEPRNYIDKMASIVRGGEHDVIVIDSLSHAWMGKGGILDQKDGKGDAFGAWRSLTPQHNALVDAILQCPLHVIVTLRAKTEYAIEKNAQGKNEVKKLGIGYVQRDGLEFEFDVVGDMDQDNYFTVAKTRCPLLSGRRFHKPNGELSEILRAWLTDGAPMPQTSPGGATVAAVDQWRTMRDTYSLSNDVLGNALEACDVASWKDADEPTRLRVVAYIRNSVEGGPPAPAPTTAPAPARNGAPTPNTDLADLI